MAIDAVRIKRLADADDKTLRSFMWNVLQAYERGGDDYLRSAIEYLVERDGIDVDAITDEPCPDICLPA